MSPNENLESFFRKIFNTPPPKEDWNTPDERVWENVRKTLDDEQKKRVKIHFLPLLFLLITLSSLGTALYQFQMNAEKDNQIISLKKQLSDCALLKENSFATKNDSAEKILNIPSISAPNTNATILKRSPELKYRTLHAKKLSTPDPSYNTKEEMDSDEPRITVTNIDEAPSAEGPLVSQNANISEPDDKELMDVQGGEVLIAHEKDINATSIHNYINQDKSELSADRVYELSILTGGRKYHLRSDRISGNQDGLVQEYFRNVPVFGLQVRRQLSNSLKASIGLVYNQRKLISNYIIHNEYNHHHESVAPDGTVDYVLHQQLATGNGEIEVEMLLNRNLSTEIKDGEVVAMEFGVTGGSRILEIPASLQYFPFRSNGLYVNGTLMAQVIGSRSVTVNHHDSHHEKLKEKHANVTFRDDNYKNLIFLAGMGLGYEYNFQKNWGIDLNFTFSRALSASYRNAAKSIFADQAGINLGVYYRFL
ncbi:MAG: hypothetical protein IPM26_07760 [Saprospiraceae bacterium]|nr:hypothetical protein [Saprospiraceae bacterium]